MKVLAIHPGHNADISYFENGKCKYILHEEKCNNIKNYTGFPTHSIEFISKIVDLSKVDYVVFPMTGMMMLSTVKLNLDTNVYELGQGSMRILYNYLEYKTGFKKFFTNFRNMILQKYVSPKAWLKIEEYLSDKYNISRDKIRKTDHHLSHCLTPYYFYGLQDVKKDLLLFSMDGSGDNYSSKIYMKNQDAIKLISETSFDSSIGLLYSEATKFLGMNPNEHEYKVMGLAAYVCDEKYYLPIYKKLKKIIWLDSETLTIKSKFNMNVASLYFKEHFCGDRFDNIASAIQKLTEELVTEYIKAAINRTGINHIALSGGVFMNVKMNQRIINLHEIEKVWFQPSSGDDSLAIGAAGKLLEDNNIRVKPIRSMFLGHEFTNKEVEIFLEQYKDKYIIKYCEDIELEVAKLLADFKIVARFNGAGEWGARSLCNRAILGNASDLKTFHEINDMIKMRDFWMPFAPTILDSWADKYISDWELLKRKAHDSTKYMILTSNTTALAQEHLRAAIHQKDKTLRPQIVEQQDNDKLYKLLKYYENITGMGGVMNSSLNIHGYPLVGTLEQAMFTLENSGLKYIAIENYLVEKQA